MNQMKAGAILSYVSIFITIGIALLYTPVMIRLLGQEEYGLYMLIGSVAAYLSVLDLGLGNAIVRYTARNRAIGDNEAESKLNGMFLILYSMIGVLTIIVGFALYTTIDNLFGASLSDTEIEKAKLMVIILVINFALSFPLSVFGSIMQAYERFVVTKMIAIIRSLLVPLVTLPLLLSGYGSVTMVLITALVNIACLLFNVFYCFKKLKTRFYFGKMDFVLLREILGYSFLVFLGIFVDQVNWNTGQLILGTFSGTATVAIFAIAIQFARLYMQFSTAISGMLLPRATIMVTNQVSNDELSRVMIKVGRIQYVVLAYILSGFILYGYAFIGFWAGQDYTQAYYVSLIIMIPITIPLIQNFGISVLQAKGMQGFRSVVLIGIALLNILISIFLVKDYGSIGVALGTGLSYAIGNAIIMNIYYQKRIGLNIPLFWKNIMLMSMPVLLTIIAGYGLNYFISQDDIFWLLLSIILFTIIYACLMWLLGLNRTEKDLFASIVRKIIKPLLKNS